MMERLYRFGYHDFIYIYIYCFYNKINNYEMIGSAFHQMYVWNKVCFSCLEIVSLVFNVDVTI
jgi:hypothetical protein